MFVDHLSNWLCFFQDEPRICDFLMKIFITISGFSNFLTFFDVNLYEIERF